MLGRSLGESWAVARRRFDQGRSAAWASSGGAAGDDPRPGEIDAIIAGLSDPKAKARLREELAGVGAGDPDGRLHLVVFGTVSSGKTSLVNALIGQADGATAAATGATRPDGPRTREVRGAEGSVLLTDTPGISGAGEAGIWSEAEATDLAVRADLLIFVVDHDLLRTEFDALSALVVRGKRAVVALNKKDRFAETDLRAILAKLRERLAGKVPPDDVVAVAADPRPVTVRVRKADGTEETLLEYEDPDLAALNSRLEAILAREGHALRAGNLLLRAHLLRKSAQEQSRREKRGRAERVVDRYQWMAAAATVAVPIPELDLMATGAVEFRMISEIAAVFGADLSAAHVQMISRQMVQTLMKRRVVETVTALVAGALKTSLIGYAAGGLIQAATIAYLTRVTGLTFVDYFESGQDWGDGGLQGALARQIDRNSRADFLRDFLRHNLGKMRRWFNDPRRGAPDP